MSHSSAWASSGSPAWHTTMQATLAFSAARITSGWLPQISTVWPVMRMDSSPLAGRAMVTRPVMDSVGSSRSSTMLPSRALTRLNTGMSSISEWSIDCMSCTAMVLVDSMPYSVPSSLTTGSARVFSSSCISFQAWSTVTALLSTGGVSKFRSLTWFLRVWISTGGSKPKRSSTSWVSSDSRPSRAAT